MKKCSKGGDEMIDDRSQYKRLPKEFFTRDRSNRTLTEEEKERGTIPLQYIELKDGTILGITINDDPEKYRE